MGARTVDKDLLHAGVDNAIEQSLKGLLLPFKGKGELRRARNLVERELDAICAEGEHMVEEFRAAFNRGWYFLPLTLTLHRAPRRSYLRWRRRAAAGAGQCYVDLVSEDGRALLAQMTSTQCQIYLAWEPRIRQWNMVGRMAMIRLCELDELLASMEAVDEIRGSLVESSADARA